MSPDHPRSVATTSSPTHSVSVRLGHRLNGATTGREGLAISRSILPMDSRLMPLSRARAYLVLKSALRASLLCQRLHHFVDLLLRLLLRVAHFEEEVAVVFHKAFDFLLQVF